MQKSRQSLTSASIVFLSLFGFSQTVQKSLPNDEELTSGAKETLVRMTNLAKDFKKLNSPGVTLSLKELSRWRAADRTLVKYQLYAAGLPQTSTYTLVQVQLSGQSLQQLTGITLDGDGRAICAGRPGTCRGKSPNSPVDLVLFAGIAEPKRFALVSDSPDHPKGVAEVIPFPKAMTDENCRLESIIGTPKGELTLIRGTGFEPNEELTTDSESYSERHHGVSKADADGSYFVAALPNVKGQVSGTTEWQVKGKNCSPKLTFSWGSYHLE